MIIKKIINNNVIVTLLHNNETVVMGRGIGFKKKIGDIVEKDKIQKIFQLSDPKLNKKIISLVKNTPEQYFQITEKIVSYASNKLSKKLDDIIYILLTDHLAFAIKRAKEDLNLQNPMLWEIKYIYKEEFEIGIWALDVVEEYTGIKLKEDEAAFIALHIVNASLGEEMYYTMNITILTKDILKIIERSFNLKFNEDSLDYMRLITHLKFFAKRVLRKEQVLSDDEELYTLLSQKYKNVNLCINKIEKYIEREFNYKLTKSEKTYLILHIQKVTGIR